MATGPPGTAAVLLPLLTAAAAVAGAPRGAAAQADPDPAGGDPIQLRLRPDSGQTLTYAFRVRAEMETPPQLGSDRSLESRMRLRQTAVRVRPDSIDYRMELSDIRLSADSVAEDQLPNLTRYEGTTFLARMTARGELVRLDRTGGPVGGEPRGISPVRRSVRMSGFPPLPRERVRRGDSWVDTTVVETGVMRGMQEGRTLAVSRTTLDSLTRAGESLVAALSVSTTYSFRRADSAEAGLEADMSGSGSSTARFDVTHGRYLESRSAQDYTVNLRYPDTPRALSVRFSVEGEARLVEVGRDEEDGG